MARYTPKLKAGERATVYTDPISNLHREANVTLVKFLGATVGNAASDDIIAVELWQVRFDDGMETTRRIRVDNLDLATNPPKPVTFGERV